jgi:hypothetical protein
MGGYRAEAAIGFFRIRWPQHFYGDVLDKFRKRPYNFVNGYIAACGLSHPFAWCGA